MAEPTLPSRVKWIEEVRKGGVLTLFTADSVGRAGWSRAFTDGIRVFNALSKSKGLGVKFGTETDRAKANVVAEARLGNFEFDEPDGPRETIIFDGTKAHGHSRGVIQMVEGPGRVPEWRVKKYFINVPASPKAGEGGERRVVGEAVKLAIAVHEMIHACGLVDDTKHTTDDVFAWPTVKLGKTPDEDQIGVVGVEYEFEVAGQKRKGHRTEFSSEVQMRETTVRWIKDVWG